MQACDQCGARYEAPEDDCAARFAELLALDHLRQEPWGSRHGSAFAVFTLQHPRGATRDQLMRCWILLHRTYIAGDPPEAVIRGLRRGGKETPQHWDVPSLPEAVSRSDAFPVTIADLGDFAPESYATNLERWCRATLDSLASPSK